MGRSHALPPTADEFNCGGEREGGTREGGRKGGYWSSFPSDCVTRTLELQPIGGKQTKPLVGLRGGGDTRLLLMRGNLRTPGSHVGSGWGAKRWISRRFTARITRMLQPD